MGNRTEFVAEAIRNNLLIIPGITFSRRDTHFRFSYAALDQNHSARHQDSEPAGEEIGNLSRFPWVC